MKSEIDGDYYCSARPFCVKEGRSKRTGCVSCSCCHRKWPTPEQYKEEYGWEVPDDFPVWIICNYDTEPEWVLAKYFDRENIIEAKDDIDDWSVVCACTPFGKPDRDWRP